MPIKTSANMSPDELIQIRALLGTYRLKKGGWCKLGETKNELGVVSFFIEAQLAGQFKSKLIPCEPEYLTEQARIFANEYDKVLSFEPLYPELKAHFSKSGKPLTHLTIIEDFIKSSEGAVFVPKGAPISDVFKSFVVMAIRSYPARQFPRFKKPFNISEWMTSK